jgi:hypothetical protein
MRRIKEVLRLRYELGLGQRQIARSCSIGQSTVFDYLKRAEAAGLRWPLRDDWDDERLERSLFAYGQHEQPSPQRPQPDFESIHEQLKRHSNLTLALLWEEYRQAQPDGYRYSRFCELYQRWHEQRSDVGRWHPRPARSQCSPYRDARRFHAEESRQTGCIGALVQGRRDAVFLKASARWTRDAKSASDPERKSVQ